MNITKGELIAGFSAVKMRDFFRKTRGGSIGIDFTSHHLAIGRSRSKKLLAVLESEGYLKSTEEKTRGKSKTWWTPTAKGIELINASAARPLTRATADRLIEELLKRVKEINTSKEFLYSVVKVILFGSYLDGNKERISDVDVAVFVVPKDTDLNNHSANCRKQSDKEAPYYAGFFERQFFSYTKTLKYLKNRSRGLSVHDVSGGLLRSDIKTKTIYEK